MAKINFEPLLLSNVSFWHNKCNPYPWEPYSRHKNCVSVYHGSKVIAKNRFWWLLVAAILDSQITKMPSGCNHYTHLILILHGTETPKMQRKDCYQTLQGSTTMPLDYNAWSGIKEVPCCFFSRSCVKFQGHMGWKIEDFDPNWVLNSQTTSNNAQSLNRKQSWIGKVPYYFFRSSVKFLGHTGWKIDDFNPNWAFLDCDCSFDLQMAT